MRKPVSVKIKGQTNTATLEGRKESNDNDDFKLMNVHFK